MDLEKSSTTAGAGVYGMVLFAEDILKQLLMVNSPTETNNRSYCWDQGSDWFE